MNWRFRKIWVLFGYICLKIGEPYNIIGKEPHTKLFPLQLWDPKGSKRNHETKLWRIIYFRKLFIPLQKNQAKLNTAPMTATCTKSIKHNSVIFAYYIRTLNFQSLHIIANEICPPVKKKTELYKFESTDDTNG